MRIGCVRSRPRLPSTCRAGTKIGDIFGQHSQGGLSAPFGTLVGLIGTTYFVLGTSFAGPAPASGNLLLFYWDSNNSDNTEFVTATIDIATAIPEPGSVLLLGLGLMGFAIRRRA